MLGSEPAFACSTTNWAAGSTGLSKRELFAAMAMQGLMPKLTNYDSYKAFVGDAVKVADALIAELAKEARDGK